MQTRPMMLNSCAKAATAAEARFRIDAPIVPSRAARVVALDDQAAAVVRRVADHPWATARFFAWDPSPGTANGSGAWQSGADGVDDLRLTRMDGAPAVLGEQLSDVDAVVMVAATDEGAQAASSIGAACSLRGIMTAGLVLSDGVQVGLALTALRPHARVLLVPADEDDLFQLLVALRV